MCAETGDTGGRTVKTTRCCREATSLFAADWIAKRRDGHRAHAPTRIFRLQRNIPKKMNYGYPHGTLHPVRTASQKLPPLWRLSFLDIWNSQNGCQKYIRQRSVRRPAAGTGRLGKCTSDLARRSLAINRFVHISRADPSLASRTDNRAEVTCEVHTFPFNCCLTHYSWSSI